MSWDNIERQLAELYGEEQASDICTALQKIQSEKSIQGKAPASLTESDAALIVYANSLVHSDSSQTPLQTLKHFITQHKLQQSFPIVHILPFYPWDTDRGFSVEDYYEVHPDYGTWGDIAALSESVRLMFDFVANHASIANPIVQNSLIARHLDRDDPRYQKYCDYEDFVIAYEANDLPSVAEMAALSRPRAAPVLTPYVVYEKPGEEIAARLGDIQEDEFLHGLGYVWTTFSRGKSAEGEEETRQVDLNFKNPSVFLETVKILLFYCERGAALIRLDAIGYLWKKLGSSSLHEPETHKLLAVLHSVMKLMAPEVVSVAEVNEPQEKVLDYLGTPGAEESDLVYQFTHFPLAVHAVQTGDVGYYAKWLDSLKPFAGRQFITVLGSHDGLGMKPVRGILPEAELEEFQQLLLRDFGGKANYAKLPGGKEIVYEICGTPWELIIGAKSDLSPELQLKKYLLIAALGLLPRGLPAFYINGILGTLNYSPEEGLDEFRSLNREVLESELISRDIETSSSRTQEVLQGLEKLLRVRAGETAFHPDAPLHKVLALGNSAVLAVSLPSHEQQESVIALHNVTAEKHPVNLAPELKVPEDASYENLLEGAACDISKISLDAFEVMWLKAC